jgi:hypothetical protein
MNSAKAETKSVVARTNHLKEIGDGLVVWSAAATFIASWIYCMQEYGFLFGFGSGWLPSALLAAVVGTIVNYLWGYILCAFAAIMVWALLSNFTS